MRRDESYETNKNMFRYIEKRDRKEKRKKKEKFETEEQECKLSITLQPQTYLSDEIWCVVVKRPRSKPVGIINNGILW